MSHNTGFKKDDLVVVQEPLICIGKNQVRSIKENKDGLYITCNGGKHFLDDNTNILIITKKCD